MCVTSTLALGGVSARVGVWGQGGVAWVGSPLGWKLQRSASYVRYSLGG